jgi:putative SOS response-associated peptidase YedK
MCNKGSDKSTRDAKAKRFGLGFESGSDVQECVYKNGFDQPAFHIIKQESPSFISSAFWGLVPYWVKDPKTAKGYAEKTLNARNETIFEKASFKMPIMKQRCLVIMDGFIEHQHRTKEKAPHFIKAKAETISCFGGVYDYWINQETNEKVCTFSIVTLPAEPESLMGQIHNSKLRQPLLFSREIERDWIKNNLTKEQIIELMNPLPDEKIEAFEMDRNSFNKQGLIIPKGEEIDLFSIDPRIEIIERNLIVGCCYEMKRNDTLIFKLVSYDANSRTILFEGGKLQNLTDQDILSISKINCPN